MTATRLDPQILASRTALEAMAADVRTAPGTTTRRLTVAARPALEVVPDASRDHAEVRATVVHLHGGGFRAGTPDGARGLASYLVAGGGGVRVLLPSYRLAPEHPYPAAVDDVAAVLHHLAGAGEPVVVLGESAGANLAAAAVLAGAPAAGVVLLSPWLGLTSSSGSYARNRATDRYFGAEAAAYSAGHYLGGADPRDPRVSPVHARDADLARFPPTLVQVSDAEVLHDEASLFARRLERVGVPVELGVWPGEQHVWHLGVPDGGAADEAVQQVRAWLRSRFGPGHPPTSASSRL